MKTITVSVSFSLCYGSYAVSETRVRMPLVVDGEAQTASEIRDAAVDRACEKLYGKNAWFWEDSGLKGYGQIMRVCKTGGHNAVTGRVSMDVEMLTALPEAHKAALKARFDEEVREANWCRKETDDGENDGYRGLPMQKGRSYEYEEAYRSASALQKQMEEDPW